eukprot:Skav228654  [mRNA]  locus=scaffold2369:123061:148536:+ [translate_table: standard]
MPFEVAGMMSVFDWSEVSSTERDRNWSGREWFVVRKAEVRMSVDQTLVPVVKMGVEAREQVLTKKGLEDAAVTANTHPLKNLRGSRGRCGARRDHRAQRMRADVRDGRDSPLHGVRGQGPGTLTPSSEGHAPLRFSYQGREGKETCVHAECMAQVLIQDRQRDENSRTKRENLKKQKNRKEYDIGWRMDSVPKCSKLAVQMGCAAAPKGLCCLVLDETSRTVKVAATLEPSAAINLEYLLLALKVRRTAQREPLFSLDPVDPQNLEKTPQKKVYEPSWLAGTSVGDVMFQADYFLKETAALETCPHALGMFQDKFNLSTEERFAGRLPACSADVGSLGHRTALGKAFLQSLQQKSWPGVKTADEKLLLNVFAVPQCDRVEEGDAFIPPDPNMEYVTRVRHMVGEEESMRSRRKMRFADKGFSVSNPGAEFPRSWTSGLVGGSSGAGFQLELDGKVPVTAPTKFGLTKIEINDGMRRMHLLEDILPSAASEFEKTAEDGAIYRIYKIGSLEATGPATFCPFVRTIQETDGQETICVVFSSGAVSWEAKDARSDDRVEKEKLSKCKMYVEAVENEASNGRVGCKFYVDGILVEDAKKFQQSLVLPQGSNNTKQYAKAIFKYVTARGLRGKWGGNRKRHAPASTSSPASNGIPGRLGLAAMGHSSDFLNVMWLARQKHEKGAELFRNGSSRTKRHSATRSRCHGGPWHGVARQVTPPSEAVPESYSPEKCLLSTDSTNEVMPSVEVRPLDDEKEAIRQYSEKFGEMELMLVVGMLSVFDWSEMTMKPNKGWAGREWFVVRKAEVRMAEDNTLIPHVKMGVEAREQVVTPRGLEDAAVTLPQHPLKKFADAFTRNFDLIAERKSVVFHLRELAKASVMAKYLIDSKACLDPSWYQIADDIIGATVPEAYPEIPQLWNMRGNSRIQLKDGKLVDVITGGYSNLQAIYGGVEFGLDRFELTQRHALQGQQKPGETPRSCLVTELRKDGSASWISNPNNLEDRNSLAKLLFQADCKDGISIPDVKNFEKSLHLSAGRLISLLDSTCFCVSPGLLSAPLAGQSKQYAKAIFKYVAVKEMSGKWGGSIKQRASSARLSSIEIYPDTRTRVDQLQL